ncbi:asparagine synthase (glutamine-hydrolyzing) [Actinocorallia sp. API 0066]|uniref:asparagine synthase (glutamine-hydrolyzing) n=1 Tax=Actinocorallia sp. API 0066 TaxID=2896846 RepID=UPI001E56C002|nr:asparagine synthase (glutamine-hydrolyzing) [Actinocorallia sp. API 0066]MCD0453414.1 asparagine synthase (glutamine-hydrolyzing) [Actinocorallia sp. API 0066]
MSGLVGCVDFTADLPEQREVLTAMTETLRDRGPDGGGVWLSKNVGLGHRALFTGAREQPQPVHLALPRGELAAVLTGTPDNLAELRAVLDRPTDAAAEVLLHAYLRWGTSCVERLHGAFAFALWDGRVSTLLLARDRMGVKPLYYHPHGTGAVFASQPAGVMAHPRFEAGLDLAKLPIVLQPRLALPGETPLKDLHEVPPAHVVRISPEGRTVQRYWRLTSAPHEDTFDKTARRVRELLEDVVARQADPAAPTGAMLSGGLDSTSVAALAARSLSPTRLRTFCVGFDGDGEHFAASDLRPDLDAPYAAEAAAHLGAEHTELTFTVPDLLAAFPATRKARDLPGWGQFDASMRLLFERVAATCRVVMTGEAADEVFGGYPYYFRPDVRAKRDGFPWMFDGPKLVDQLAPDVTAEITPGEDERARYETLLAEVPRLPGEDPAEARIRELLYFGMCGPLTVVLDRKERMSASVGLDVRMPFCDHRLVEYVWNVPWAMKSAGGVKGLLKAAMGDLLPPAVLRRAKSAYPHVQNPAYEEALLTEAAWIVNDPGSPLAPLFDTARMNALIGRIRAGRMAAELPGGATPAALLIQLVEMHHWIEGNRIRTPA